MKKHYKVLLFPAVIILIAGILSGYGERSYEQIVKDLLQERTAILQNSYYDKIDLEQAEEKLRKIETYPLLSEDIYTLRNTEATEIDKVKSMEFNKMEQQSKMFNYVSFDTEIQWYLEGYDGDYTCNNCYSVVMKSLDGDYKLSEFNAE